ncbi:hypothetical protein ACP4OV_029746 [Aristida adscensionis]
MEEEEAAQREAIAARMRGRDYAGARTLLLETLQANPRLEDAVGMLAVLEVLCAAGRELAGRGRGRGVDWYRVLQVLPGDDAARIDAQYRSIVAQVEPVAREVPGAELALSLVKEAYAVLSDPEKRAVFDSGDVFAQFAPFSKSLDVDQLSSLHTVDKRAVDVRDNSASHSQHADSERFSPDESHVDKKQKSLWEKDAYCISPSHVDFDGCFDDPPDAKEDERDERCSSKQYDYHNFEDDRAIEQFAVGQVWAAYDWERFPRRYALISEVLADKMQLYVSWFKPCLQSDEEKKWSHACLPIVCGTFDVEEHHISVTSPTIFCHQISCDNLNQNLQVSPQKGEVWAVYSDWDIGWCTDPGMWKKTAFSVVEVLTSYSEDSGCTVAHLEKVDGYRSVFQRYMTSAAEHHLQVHISNLLMFSHRIPSFRCIHEVGTMFELEPSAVPENLQHENTLECFSSLSPRPGLYDDTTVFRETGVAQCSNPSTSKMDSAAPLQGIMSCNNKLSPEDFLEGQIWAVYDSRDRMPRSYVRIIRVVSSTAVSVLKLEPHPMLNEEIRWVEDGLPVACGVFRAGTETTYKDIWEFSHPVECDWSARRSFYRIFPKKGEIWAMYKNWKITLNSTDIDKCEPRMVEILSDYSDENGVNACSLARVKGRLTFFHRIVMDGFQLTRWFSRSEMLSFSHRVPAFIVVEIRDHDIPEGSWHLEPSALPTRFIH